MVKSLNSKEKLYNYCTKLWLSVVPTNFPDLEKPLHQASPAAGKLGGFTGSRSLLSEVLCQKCHSFPCDVIKISNWGSSCVADRMQEKGCA